MEAQNAQHTNVTENYQVLQQELQALRIQSAVHRAETHAIKDQVIAVCIVQEVGLLREQEVRSGLKTIHDSILKLKCDLRTVLHAVLNTPNSSCPWTPHTQSTQSATPASSSTGSDSAPPPPHSSHATPPAPATPYTDTEHASRILMGMLHPPPPTPPTPPPSPSPAHTKMEEELNDQSPRTGSQFAGLV